MSAEKKKRPVNIEAPAEHEIRRAVEEGAFDNLPGAGKPIPGIDQPYDENWWLKGMLKRENLSVLPQTLELRAEIEKDIEKMWHAFNESDLSRQFAAINAKIRKLNSTATTGPATTVSEMDAQAVVERWKRRG